MLQEKLKLLNYFPGSVTGSYGPETSEAVEQFQRVYNLPVTGIVDIVTWQTLLEETEKFVEVINVEPTLKATQDIEIIDPVVLSRPILRIGDTGPEAAELQTLLTELLYYNGPITGIFNNETNITVRMFQTNNRITADGIVGPKTWSMILYLYAPLTTCEPTETRQEILESTNLYIVKRGDSLWSIAEKFNATVQQLMTLNFLINPNLEIGQQLIVPDANTSNQFIYTVQAGDYLYALSKKYNTSIEEIKKTNQLTSDFLNVGQTLIMPVNKK
ncbi:MAG: peptidoglycan-binding protein [Coprobacillaceae bacterium]